MIASCSSSIATFPTDSTETIAPEDPSLFYLKKL